MNNGELSKARLSRMYGVMAGYVERDEVPGIVTLVSRRGEVLRVSISISGPRPTRLSTTETEATW
jgi:hypothetical protein